LALKKAQKSFSNGTPHATLRTRKLFGRASIPAHAARYQALSAIAPENFRLTKFSVLTRWTRFIFLFRRVAAGKEEYGEYGYFRR